MLTVTGVGRCQKHGQSDDQRRFEQMARAWTELVQQEDRGDHCRIGQMVESSDRVSSALFATSVVLKVCKELSRRHKSIHRSGTLDCCRRLKLCMLSYAPVTETENKVAQ